jgi:hypothetical protein
MTMRITSAGHAVFAVTIIGLGILGLHRGDFTVIWAPVPVGVPGRGLLIYLCPLVSLTAGAGLLWRRTAALGARVLLIHLLLWLLVFRAPGLFRSLAVDVYWATCSTLVMVAAAGLLYARLATDSDRKRLGAAIGAPGIRVARAMFGVAMIGFGIAHFQYIQNTASLVPGWLPGHVVWAYLTGATFVAAGVAALTGVYAHLAVSLAAWQMGLFLLLVWIPRVAAGATNDFQRGEAVVSWVLTAAAWVVAESYR